MDERHGVQRGAMNWLPRPVGLGLAALNLLVVAITAFFLWRAWSDMSREYEQQALASARLLEQVSAQTLDKISLSMDAVADRVVRRAPHGAVRIEPLAQDVERIARRVPEIQVIRVFDASGNEACGQPAGTCAHLLVADRDYFHYFLANPDAPAGVFGPYTSKVDSREILIVARALNEPGQPFAGVVVALVPTDRWRQMLAQVNAGHSGAVSLRTLGLRILVREPPAVKVPGQGDAAWTPSAALLGHIQRAPLEGVYRGASFTDGVDRIHAYRKVQDWPLYVMVGGDFDELTTRWSRIFGIAVALMCAFLLTCWGLLKAIRRAAREHARARELYDNAPCGYHSLDAQGRFMRINATQLGWLGCEASEVVGRLGPKDFMSEQGREAFDQVFPKFKREGHLEGFEFDLLGRQGGSRRVVVSARAVVDERGQFVCSNSVLYDISQLHESRQELKRLHEEHWLMLNTEAIGIAKLRNRCVVWANAGMTHLFGYAQDEWVGLPMRKLYLDEETYLRIGAQTYPILQAGRTSLVEVQMRRRDGSRFWAAASGAPLQIQNGEVLMMVTDISALKEAELARLREVELHALNDQLRETSRLKDEFLSNMSHELRTPLNAILGFSALLSLPDGCADADKTTRYLDEIQSSGKHLLGLINSMLEFATLEARKVTFHVEAVDVGDVIRQCMGMREAQAQQKGVTVSLQHAGDLGAVQADALRLRQIVTNLLDNAIKFSGRGGRVRIRAGHADDAHWFVEVADEGIGIAPQDLPRIFTPFHQLSSGMTKTHGGTGLGLALTLRLVRALGGDLQVESQPGRGSVFRVHLPQVPPPPAVPD